MPTSPLSVNLSAESGSPKSADNHSDKSESEYSEFVHENEEEKEEQGRASDASMYEPCTCERCDPKPTYVSRFVGWLDSRVLKRFLVYNYTPENIVAQNEVQELLENDGAEDGGGNHEH